MFFEDMIKEDPTLSYADAEAVVWDNYPHDFRAFWGMDQHEPPEHLDGDTWREYRSAAQLVERLAQGASQLVRPRKTTDEKIAQYPWLIEEADRMRTAVIAMMEENPEIFPRDMWWKVFELLSALGNPEGKRRFMSACMQLEVVRLYPENTEEKAERLFALVTYLTRKPSQRCREYLPRVAECYVRGLDVELAVMARAVLEAALQDEFPDERNLERRIQIAVSRGLFQSDAFDAANRLRTAGNAAAHADLSLKVDPDAVMGDLFNCLTAMDG